MYYTLCLLPPILHNPVSCGANGLLGDAHDAVDVAVVYAHLVEAEEDRIALQRHTLLAENATLSKRERHTLHL